jgi:transketolase
VRTAFIETFSELAALDERVWLLTGDLGFSVVEGFARRFPKRFVNVGVAEQNLIGVAAGLALSGKIPFAYSIANFPVMRCLEQLRNDVCYHALPVRVVAVGGGMAYGTAGFTHHGIEDLGVLRTLPNLTVLAPADPHETRAVVRALVDLPGPAYLRLGKAGEPVVHPAPPDLVLGKALWLREGKDLAVLSTGGVLGEALAAVRALETAGISAALLSVHTIYPLDEEAVARASSSGKVLTVEEHGRGGLASAVAEALCRAGRPVRLRSLRLPDAPFVEVYSQEAARRRCGLDSEGIVQAARELLSAPAPGR